ncbi:uncharacterized protein METZ01_LOCUS49860 [marine metagenome]|uniref:F5/8 type C domain-containing protein n=1 Tax=marine metagenome TaxID=408172 RepID=A0A381RYS0_9ZZZZ
MEENFVSLKNFKHLYKLLNEYSEKKYKKKLDLKQYKKLIGNTINEISIKYKNKIKKKEKNIMTIMIIKKIIDKENKKEESFFESDFEPNQKITKKDIEKNYNLNNIQYQNLELERERNYNKILRNDNNNFNIKAIKRDEEKFRKNLIENKKKFEEIEKKKNLKNINESIIINPKEYKETLKKYIRKYDLLIDSKDRDITLFEENEYQIELDEPIHNVFSIELLNAIIPNSDYIINNRNNLLHFEENNTEQYITIPIGNYTLSELGLEIQTVLNNIGTSLYSVSTSNIHSKINNLEVDGSNTESNNGDAYKIFDYNLNTHWESPSLSSYIIYDFQKQVIIQEYFILCTNNTGRPKTFTLEISNDKINWTIIDTQTNISISNGRYHKIEISNILSSRYMKLNITNSSNNTNVHITQLEFKSKVENRINIASDMTNGNFSLLFEDKENSISEILGFQSKNYINFSNYTSDNEIILDSDRNIFLSIENIDNIQTTNEKLTNVFLKLTLNSDKNKYTYIKTDKDNIYKMGKPKHIKKLLIQFKKYDNSLYNFNGLDHSLILRINHFNTKHI